MKKLSKLSKRYLQPILERDFSAKDHENKLISIEHEEAIKENLRRSVHVRRQGTVEAMASQDSQTFDLLDDHHDKVSFWVFNKPENLFKDNL